LSAGDRQAIEAAVEGLKKALESNDAAAIASGMNTLRDAQHKAAANLYQQAQGGGAAGPGGAEQPRGGAESSGNGPAQGDVIDAEVVDEGKP
jgi:molecular chaperone DnaK